jgi:hypothetical protein
METVFSPYIQGVDTTQERNRRRQIIRNALAGITTIGALASVISTIMGINTADALRRISDAVGVGGGGTGSIGGPINRPTTGPISGPTGEPTGPKFPVPTQETMAPSGSRLPWAAIDHQLPPYNTDTLNKIRQDLPKVVKVPVSNIPEQVEDQVQWHSFNFVPNGFSNGDISNNDLYKSSHKIDQNRYSKTFGLRTPDVIPVDVNKIPHRPVFYPVYQNNQPFRDCFDDRPFQHEMLIDTIPKNSAYQRQIIRETENIYYPNLSQFEFNLARK